ncbi:MAG: caspase family protein [Akkermansiaceae bacterium]|nr:caspase family protein [Akkermansiaceae bacterium]
MIGNNDYANARKLVNPTNDAKVIAKSLTSLGFEVIKAHRRGLENDEGRRGSSSKPFP